MNREWSPSQDERIERYVAQREYPGITDFGRAMTYQGAMHMEESAERIAMATLNNKGIRRMSLIRRLVRNLNSEEWFRMASVANHAKSVRNALLDARKKRG